MGGLPRLIRPMLASVRRELPADDDRYGWEFKWDGVRAVAYVSGGRVRLLSRSDKEMTASYPELAVLAERVGDPVILDGEIVALRDGRPDFAALQSRMHVRRPPGWLVRGTPAELYLFDLLHWGEESLLGLPYAERRERLAGLGLGEDPVRTPPWYRGDARTVLAASIAHGLEGVVGKPLASAYHPGQRRDWIKIKNVRRAEVVICGWKPGEGRRADTIGSLLLGVYDEGRLRYVGHVGTGFTQRALADLMRRLAPLRRDASPFDVAVPAQRALADLMRRLAPLRRDASPFDVAVPAQHARGAQWVEPRLVGEVAFTEWTPDLILRHPAWRGLRPDVAPGEVHRAS
jgi:bifunctional non-homologous end joining protein LigD